MTAKGELGVRENKSPYGLSIGGPADLPFDHHDIRVYIDNLFLEGLLHPVPHDSADLLSETWVSVGVRTDPSKDRSHRITKLIDNLQASLPGEDARHVEWFQFSRGWAELALLIKEQFEDIPDPTWSSASSSITLLRSS